MPIRRSWIAAGINRRAHESAHRKPIAPAMANPAPTISTTFASSPRRQNAAPTKPTRRIATRPSRRSTATDAIAGRSLRRSLRERIGASDVAADAGDEKSADERAHQVDPGRRLDRDGLAGRAEQDDPAPHHHDAVHRERARTTARMAPTARAGRSRRTRHPRSIAAHEQRRGRPPSRSARTHNDPVSLRDHSSGLRATNSRVSNRFLRTRNRKSSVPV